MAGTLCDSPTDSKFTLSITETDMVNIQEYDIMSVSEQEQAEHVHRERRMAITTAFEEIVKHEGRIVI